jgi:AhpD family alkylhydroperoxidase
MSLFPLIEDSEATGKVRAIFDDIKATKEIDFVPNIWRALANNPDHLELTWGKLKAVMGPGTRLDPLTKEIIALAVSITNGCDYCINSHSAAVLKLGLDPEQLGEIVAVVDVFNGTNRIANAYQIEPDVRPKAP